MRATMCTLFVIVILATTLASPGFSTAPPEVVTCRPTHHLGSDSISCQFNSPLTDCRARIWIKSYIDAELHFGRGDLSPTVPVSNTHNGGARMFASYEGAGLASGSCGVKVTGGEPGYYMVQFRGRSEAGWSRGFGLLRYQMGQLVTSSSRTPSFILAGRGSHVSVDLKLRGTLHQCDVVTPAEGVLALTQGQAPPPGSRYRLQGASFGRRECIYTLTNVTEADAGLWQWAGKQTLGYKKAYQVAVVAIAAPPTGVPQLAVNDESTLSAGTNVTATCWTPPSVPPANMTWLLGGKVIRADAWNATLDEDTARTALPWQPQPARQTLSRLLTSSDLGKRLECRVDHVALSGPQMSGVMLRPRPDVPVVTAEKAVVRSAEGYFTELACLVDARYEATVQWTRGATPVATSELVIVGREGARHWLRLEDPDEHDLTTFNCTAQSPGGSATAVITVTGVPGQPQWAGNGSASQLAWTVESYVDLNATALNIRQGKGGWKKVGAVVTARLNGTTLLLRHEFRPAVTGDHQAVLSVTNVYGISAISAVHKFFADVSLVVSAPLECGVVDPTFVPDGQDAALGQFPWHAGIFVREEQDFLYQCGGSLVTPRHVISAAHCFHDESTDALDDASLYRVALGTIAFAWASDVDRNSAQRFTLLNITISEFFNGHNGNYVMDIAVLRLASDAVVTRNVRVICLDWSRAFMQTGEKATAAVWGSPEWTHSDTLQWAELPFVAKDLCRAHLRRVGKLHFYTADKFCAGVANRTTSVCPGDSGGGLVVRNSTTGRYSLVGVGAAAFDTAFSTATTCLAEPFAGFTAVSEHADWLPDVLGPLV